MSPLKLGFILVMMLLIARSAIVVICATAEVRILENCGVASKIAVVFIVGNDQLTAIT